VVNTILAARDKAMGRTPSCHQMAGGYFNIMSIVRLHIGMIFAGAA
jgi:hypothetical protein